MAYYGIMRYHDKRIYKDTSVIISDDCDIYSRRILNHPPLSNHGPKKFRRWILLKSNRLSDSQLFFTVCCFACRNIASQHFPTSRASDWWHMKSPSQVQRCRFCRRDDCFEWPPLFVFHWFDLQHLFQFKLSLVSCYLWLLLVDLKPFNRDVWSQWCCRCKAGCRNPWSLWVVISRNKMICFAGLIACCFAACISVRALLPLSFSSFLILAYFIIFWYALI